MSGAEITAEIDAAFEEAGIAAGKGKLTATITRLGADQTITEPTDDHPDASEFAPVVVAGTPDVSSFTYLPISQERAQRAGMALESGERVYSLVNHGVSIAPTTADRLEIDGKTCSIVEVIEQSVGYALTWLVRVKN